MLTDKTIQKLKPGTHVDGGGLYLRVSEKGKRSWLVRSQVAGRNNAKVIGAYPGMTLATARKIASGAMPDLTMSDAIKSYLVKLKVIRTDQVKALLNPLLSLSLHSDRKTLVEILQQKAKKAPTHANRMLTRWKDFLNFCVQQGWLEVNVLEPVQRRFVGGKESARNRVLSWEEIQQFLQLNLVPSTKRALYFILATGLRPTEALWVLRNNKVSGIPLKPTRADPSPIGKLPAVPHIKAILKKGGIVPKSHLTLSNALRRKGVDFTPHDLRRTFATRLSDLGVLPHVIEKCLNHRMIGVMAVYNHAEYWDERVKAMRVWGHKLSWLRRTSAASARASGQSAGT